MRGNGESFLFVLSDIDDDKNDDDDSDNDNDDDEILPGSPYSGTRSNTGSGNKSKNGSNKGSKKGQSPGRNKSKGKKGNFGTNDEKKKRNVDAVKYPWTCMKSKEEESSIGTDKKKTDTTTTAAGSVQAFHGTITQFAVFSPTYMSFGASESQGTNAIRVDSNLSTCHCGPSDTYSNSAYSILGGKENVSFAIDTVEVYSDHHSYHKMMTREEKLRRNRNNG